MCSFLLLAVLLSAVFCIPAFAVTESEVEAQVAASGKGAVAGNLLIWFLCAVAFLKVSQKIDSFMAVLGVNVGRTGGSLLAEAMIAMRAVTMMVGSGHGASAGRAGSAAGGTSGRSGTSGMTGFFKGGLVGMAGRHITNSAVRTATTQTSAVHTSQQRNAPNMAANAAAQTSGGNTHVTSNTQTGGNSVQTGGVNLQTSGSGVNMPPQEGVIVTGGGAPVQAVPPEGAPLAGSTLDGAAQAGIPDTSGIPSAQTNSVENVLSAASVSNGLPPQEGVILTGSEAKPSATQADAVPNVPTAAEIPDDLSQPQEGIILTGYEAPPQAPMTDTGPQEAGTPVEVPQADQDTVITGGNTVFHASQTGDSLSVNPAAPGAPSAPADKAGGEAAGSSQHTHTKTEQRQAVRTSQVQTPATARPSLGGMIFSRSLAAGGSFAHNVIGTVARGEVAGSITGDMAAQSLLSYLGYGVGETSTPTFSSAEIGRGRITGSVSTPEHPEPIAFGMYHTEQHAEPKGTFSTVRSVDGTLWYTQLAQDTVERKPYKAPDDTVAYHEKIVKKLPDAPKRKDRM